MENAALDRDGLTPGAEIRRMRPSCASHDVVLCLGQRGKPADWPRAATRNKLFNMLSFLSVPELVLLAAVTFPGVVLALLANRILEATPVEFRALPPQRAWILAIPVLWLLTNLLVHPKVSRSVAAQARAQGRSEFGECSAALARIFSLCLIAGVLLGPMRILGFSLLVLGFVQAAVFYARLVGISRQLSQTDRREPHPRNTMAGPGMRR